MGQLVGADRVQTTANLPAGQMARRRGVRSRQQNWYAIVISLGVVAAIIGLAMTADFLPIGSILSSLAQSKASSDPREAQLGTIIVRRENGECQQTKFDNDSGRTVARSALCDNGSALDPHGVPVPQGTVHPLDAISKSFSGH